MAELLAQCGYRVIGLDARPYLASLTEDSAAAASSRIVEVFTALIKYAWQYRVSAPLLIGVSEGAGLSVLAGTSHRIQSLIQGVIGIGLGDASDAAWRWTSLAHGLEVPLAIIRSAHGESVPADEAARIVSASGGPARVWNINASDHRFSGRIAEFDRRLVEAIEWVASQRQPAGMAHP